MSFMVSLCWCSTDSIKNSSSLRSDGMSVLAQAAVFLISHNLKELLRTVNVLKSDFSFLTCASIIWYTLYSEFFWVPIKAEFRSKMRIKIGFIDFFFLMLEYSTTFFLLLSTSSLCGFQNYNFCLDGALKKIVFSVLLVAWKSWKLRVCVLGFVASFNMPASEHWKWTNFEVWSLYEVDGNKLLTYMVMPISSCQSVIIIPNCIMMVTDNEVPKIRVKKMLLQWVIFVCPIWYLVFKLFCLKLARTVELTFAMEW